MESLGLATPPVYQQEKEEHLRSLGLATLPVYLQDKEEHLGHVPDNGVIGCPGWQAERVDTCVNFSTTSNALQSH
ncbi:hypothetical protein TIFTF001_005376 [Ficus carica]|uniref:Uncharacterized protein n=1 Tax=Ficus carica TaxID=3494 RepID=A0AA87ZLK5_FICCA|nr:hypothetical protein TIFTF001_005376 [Ficus carica]